MPDCAAIYHIGVKRGLARGQPWDAVLRAYSVPVRRGTARARRIMGWPADDVRGLTARENRAWKRLRGHAAALLAGRIADPCPEATDWNDRDSKPRGRMVEVCHGLTRNRLYRGPL